MNRCKTHSFHTERYKYRLKGPYTDTPHSMVNDIDEGLSASLGKAETEESTTICFSWLRYPFMKPLKIMFATKHSTSSSGTAIPATERAVWNIDIGIRVPFPVATHLQKRGDNYTDPASIIPRGRMTYTRRNKPRRQSSRAFSRENHKFNWSNRDCHLSRASSYPWISPIRIAAMKGENISSRTGNRCKSSFEGRWPFKIRSGIRYAKMRLKWRDFKNQKFNKF